MCKHVNMVTDTSTGTVRKCTTFFLCFKRESLLTKYPEAKHTFITPAYMLIAVIQEIPEWICHTQRWPTVHFNCILMLKIAGLK